MDDFDCLLIQPKGESTPSALDLPLTVTRFPNQAAASKSERRMSLRDLATEIAANRATEKGGLPFYKLASFGDARTDKRSLRHNDNVTTVWGIEGDYDGRAMGLDEAERLLRAVDLAALIYTTPSHAADAPRWRIMCPCSRGMAPGDRAAMVARVNGVLGGALDSCSFVLSQAFYAGNVDGRPPIETRPVDGRFLDVAGELDAGAIGKPGGQPDGDAEPAADRLGITLEDSRAILAGLPMAEWCDSRDGWIHVAMALKHEHGDDGYEVLDEFSQRAPRGYKPRENLNQWESIDGRAANPRTMRSLIRPSGESLATLPSRLAAFIAWCDDLPDRDDDSVFERESIDGFDMSEDGVALAFAARHAEKLRFDHTAGSWFAWCGSHWRRESTALAFQWAREICRERFRADPRAREAKAMSKAASAAAVERFARADRAFALTADAWDNDPWILATPAGTVDLKTGRVHPANSAAMVTKITAAAPVPLEAFNPERDCPRWLRFLDDATAGDAGAIRFLQQWAGYSLTGDTREESLLFVHGPGGSGKSTAINTLGDLMGDYAVNVGAETLAASKFDRHTTELARLRGARMARASETEQGRAWAQQRIKALTGGDTITARFMRQDDFEFVPEFKLTIVGNHAPAIENVDDAMRRRFNVLPFTHRPPTVDNGLKDALRAEFPGILSWAIVGCLDWQRNGLTRPAIIAAATDDYFEQQDAFASWIEDSCDVAADHVDTGARLWASWQSFARLTGEDPGSAQRTFPERLVQHGFARIKDTRGIRGLKRPGFSGGGFI